MTKADKAINTIALVGLLVAVFAAIGTNIFIVAVNDGDKNETTISFRSPSLARGTLTASRVENEMSFHIILENGYLGAIDKIAIYGPTGDPPLVADPGPEILRLCGAPAEGCLQVGLRLDGTSQEVIGSGPVSRALEYIRQNPHRFWIQIDTFNTTAAVLMPLSA